MIKSLVRFLVVMLGLWLCWYLIYDLILQPNGLIDHWVVGNVIDIAAFLLEIMGFDLFFDNRLVGIVSTSGLWVGDACNGIELFVVFSIFILALPQKAFVKKTIFIIVGILSIHLINIFRVVGLLLTQYYQPILLEFNHNYTFKLIVYGYIFLLWILWINKYSTFSWLQKDKI